MRFQSTRAKAPEIGLSEALTRGLAPDGGLYLPTQWPRFELADFNGADSLQAVACTLLAPFFADDPLAEHLPAIVTDAFNFEVPVRSISANRYLLELVHGPTAAFKDFGARFLAQSLQRIESQQGLTILVATSGDTGAAVGSAFDGLPGFKVVILYPDGRVSPRQAHQLGAFGSNVVALKIGGSFDDCQALVKRALNDETLRRKHQLSSANSISLGRLLPQTIYYAYAALQHHRQHGSTLSFAIPTGNLGNALGAIIAKRLGLPIASIKIATNANDVLPQYFSGEAFKPKPSIQTLANAMDVGDPSNFERLQTIYGDDASLRSEFTAVSVDDHAIERKIRSIWQQAKLAICPHTATAFVAIENEPCEAAWAVVSTAHAAKFDTIVESLIGAAIRPPPALQALLDRKSLAIAVPNDYQALLSQLERIGGRA